MLMKSKMMRLSSIAALGVVALLGFSAVSNDDASAFPRRGMGMGHAGMVGGRRMAMRGGMRGARGAAMWRGRRGFRRGFAGRGFGWRGGVVCRTVWVNGIPVRRCW